MFSLLHNKPKDKMYQNGNLKCKKTLMVKMDVTYPPLAFQSGF